MAMRRAAAGLASSVAPEAVLGRMGYTTTAPAAARAALGFGGRSSQGGQVVTVFGATGMMGKYVVNELGRQGHTVFIAHRGDDMEWRHLKLMGDLGKIAIKYYSPRDMDSVREAMEHSDTVINLVGKRYETSHFLPFIRNYTYYDTNVRVAENIANASVELGVEHFVHVSALAASEDSMSEWARTKAVGEKHVRQIRPDAVVVRPSQLFGTEDKWLNQIAWLARTRLPFLKPFIIGDGDTKTQPLWAADAGKAVARAAMDKSTAGKLYQIAGPEVYTHKEVVEYVLETIQTDVTHRSLPAPVAEAMSLPFDLLYEPKLVHDMVRLMQEDNALNLQHGELGIDDLGVSPANMKNEAMNFLLQYKKGGNFIETV